MPQSKEVHKEYMRLRRGGLPKDASERRRDKQKGMTKGMTEDGTYFKDGIEMVPPAYIPGITDVFMMLPERPRYLDLGTQTLDRANPPVVKIDNVTASALLHCNEAGFNYKPANK